MAEAVVLPKVGMTMEEGTLTRWLAADGSAVKEHDPLFELETEKVAIEVEARASGILRHFAAEGTSLKPGDVVGCLVAPDEEIPADLLLTVAAQSLAPAPHVTPKPPSARLS